QLFGRHARRLITRRAISCARAPRAAAPKDRAAPGTTESRAARWARASARPGTPRSARRLAPWLRSVKLRGSGRYQDERRTTAGGRERGRGLDEGPGPAALRLLDEA